jgi:hypothetical protein
MAHNIALALAVMVCCGGVWAWNRYQAGGFRRSSPTLPHAGDADEFPQVIDEPEPPTDQQGRGTDPQPDAGRTDVHGAWIRAGRTDVDDDDDD